MPYTNLAELTDRYGEALLLSLSDRADPPAGLIDSDVIDQALAGADALIDGYLTGRYKLPLSATPPLIADLAQAIAIHKLHLYDPPQKVKDDHAGAMTALRDIAKGVVRLPVDGVEPVGTGAGGVRVNDRERPLTPENMKGLI